MPIEWIEDARQLHLHNGQVSLVLRALESGHLGQLHLGAPLAPGRDYRHLLRGAFPGFDNRVADPTRFALPTWGSGDFRAPAVAVRHADGSAVLHLEFAGHRILRGKPAIDPLPATYVEDDAEAETVEITLVDRPSGVEVALLLTIWRDLPRLRDPERFGVWTYRIVTRASIAEAKRKRRSVSIADIGTNEPAVSDATAGIATRDLLDRAFARLTPESRAVLVLRYYVDLPNKDIADILGIPYGTVGSRLHRAIGDMRSLLGADWPTSTSGALGESDDRLVLGRRPA